jgi:hypothetical protein
MFMICSDVKRSARRPAHKLRPIDIVGRIQRVAGGHHCTGFLKRSGRKARKSRTGPCITGRDGSALSAPRDMAGTQHTDRLSHIP